MFFLTVKSEKSVYLVDISHYVWGVWPLQDSVIFRSSHYKLLWWMVAALQLEPPSPPLICLALSGPLLEASP